MKNTIMIISEKRVLELEKTCQEGIELLNLLNRIKGSLGYEGATVKEMKSYGETLPNDIQVTMYISNYLRGISINYFDYISISETYRLNCVTVKDFNGLVKAIYDNKKFSIAV